MSVSNHSDSGVSGAGATARVGRLSRAAQAVLPALAQAAARTGVDFNALFHTARLESGFNPQAKASTSSATGLFQFVESTWLSTLARHGAQHGIAAGTRAEALELRRDPAIASLMAAAHMADNAATLQAKLGRAAGTVDLYLAHFLGAGGAARFLGRLAEAPDTAASTLLPAAAGANRSIFFDNGRPRSLRQVHDLFAARLGTGDIVQTGESQSAENQSSALQTPAIGAPSLDAKGTGEALDALLQAVTGNPAARTSESAFADATASKGAQTPAAAARIAYLLLADLGA